MKEEISDRLKKIRQALNLKQKELAIELNIAPSSYSEIETGKSNPGLDIIVTLARKYNVNLYYLLMGEGEMFISPEILSLTRLEEYALNKEHVRDFFRHFQKSESFQYYILSEFTSRVKHDKKEMV